MQNLAGPESIMSRSLTLWQIHEEHDVHQDHGLDYATACCVVGMDIDPPQQHQAYPISKHTIAQNPHGSQIYRQVAPVTDYQPVQTYDQGYNDYSDYYGW